MNNDGRTGESPVTCIQDGGNLKFYLCFSRAANHSSRSQILGGLKNDKLNHK